MQTGLRYCFELIKEKLKQVYIEKKNIPMIALQI